MFEWVWTRVLDVIDAACAGHAARLAVLLAGARADGCREYWHTDDTQRRVWSAAAAAPDASCLALLLVDSGDSGVPRGAPGWCYAAARAPPVVAWLAQQWPPDAPGLFVSPAARDAALMAAGARTCEPMLRLLIARHKDWWPVLMGAVDGEQWLVLECFAAAAAVNAHDTTDSAQRNLCLGVLASPRWARARDTAGAARTWAFFRRHALSPPRRPLAYALMLPLLEALGARRLAARECPTPLERLLVDEEQLPVVSPLVRAPPPPPAVTAKPDVVDAVRLGRLDVLTDARHWPRLRDDAQWRASLRFLAGLSQQPGLVALLDAVGRHACALGATRSAVAVVDDADARTMKRRYLEARVQSAACTDAEREALWDDMVAIYLTL